MQNAVVKIDQGTHKILKRGALKELLNIGTISILAITPKVSNSTQEFLFVGRDTADDSCKLYSMSSLTATPAAVKTIYSAGGLTYNAACTITVVTNTFNNSLYHIQFHPTTYGSLYSGWVYDSVAATLTEITDADYLNSAGHSTYPGAGTLDGYIFVVGSEGKIINNTSPFILTGYNALGYITPDGNGGAPIRVESYKNHIVCFGTKAIEFFYDAANASPASPLSARLDLIFNYGILQQTKYRQIWKAPSGESLSFIGINSTGKPFVGMFEEFNLTKISNEAIDLWLTNNTAASTALSGISFAGEDFIVLSVDGTGVFMYQVSTKIWSVLSSSLFSTHTIIHDILNGYSGYSIVLIKNSSNNYGKVYYVDNSAFQDTDSTPTSYNITRIIQTNRFRGPEGDQSSRKFQHELQLISDTATSAGTVSVTYTDDDYQNFSTARTIDMTSTKKQLQRLGYFRERAFKLSDTLTEQVRLELLEGQIQIGTN